MIRPGEIYPADTDPGRRPAIVVSRAELNRGPWVVAVLVTSTHFAARSRLPLCVAFASGEYGLTKDCVAQAETITYLAVSDLDLDSGAIGVLDEVRMRELIKAIGDLLASDCEPVRPIRPGSGDSRTVRPAGSSRPTDSRETREEDRPDHPGDPGSACAPAGGSARRSPPSTRPILRNGEEWLPRRVCPHVSSPSDASSSDEGRLDLGKPRGLLHPGLPRRPGRRLGSSREDWPGKIR
jgi:mRNA-degrading endonuclease toxin of MazEF toxin-antitoxin module